MMALVVAVPLMSAKSVSEPVPETVSVLAPSAIGAELSTFRLEPELLVQDCEALSVIGAAILTVPELEFTVMPELPRVNDPGPAIAREGLLNVMPARLTATLSR